MGFEGALYGQKNARLVEFLDSSVALAHQKPFVLQRIDPSHL
jgi:hypothetical protein